MPQRLLADRVVFGWGKALRGAIRERGEIDDAIRLVNQRGRLARELDAILGRAGQRARVPADQRRARVFEHAGERKTLDVGNSLHQRAPQAPACPATITRISAIGWLPTSDIARQVKKATSRQSPR